MSSDAKNDEQRIPSVREAITDQLLACGSSQTPVQGLSVTVNEWRSSARAVGRALNRPIKTFVAGEVVFAVLGDWPTGAREEELHQQSLQRAAAAVNESFERHRDIR
ncbi:hypothetical protein EB834_18570 [Brevibacterium aurantiacum]|uniref:Uncharacterized protein n=1 Tax=Brevibacterium aurantiacum TaxID=273384 RepID=A0A4Z0KDR5_BREAU|nr:hypothetical protein EB834_18570 [Brevibacterium aurantiacum]